MKLYKLSLIFLQFTVLSLISNIGNADVMSPVAEELNTRANKNPNLIDRTDQYCMKKKIQDQCSIPGDSFSGGGNGVCIRELNEKAGTLDLNCFLYETLVMDRNIPAGPYQAPEGTCDDPEFNGLVCDEPPLVADKFCNEKAENDICEVQGNLKVKGKITDTLTFQGKCKITKDIMKTYYRGHKILSRPILMCSPNNPVPEKTHKELSFFRKLWLNF